MQTVPPKASPLESSVAETDIVTLSIVPGAVSAAFPEAGSVSTQQKKPLYVKTFIHYLMLNVLWKYGRGREETAICHPLPFSLLIQQLGEKKRGTPDPL